MDDSMNAPVLDTPYASEDGLPGSSEKPVTASNTAFISESKLAALLGAKVVVVAACSFVLMLQASIDCSDADSLASQAAFFMSGGCKNELAYAVAVSVVSLFVCIAYLLVAKLSPDALHEKTLLILSSFLFVWWLIGACVLTFDTPYPYTSNAYFACWLAFGFSASLLQSEAAEFRSLVGRLENFHASSKVLSSLALASVIEIVAAIKPCSDYVCENENAFAIALGTVSVVFAALLLVVQIDTPGLTKFISVFLVVWWTCGVGVATFKGPFTFTGNGFFASWAGLIFSVFLASQELSS